MIAILPMSCALYQKSEGYELKQKLLDLHTLEAVLSMADDLFYPIGTNTCIMIFKAHQPHQEGYKTYFGYWKDDGFVKKKHQGRVETARWNTLKKKWLNSYINKENEIGFSVKKEVNAEMEWCSEAYMETNYNNIKEENFINTIRNYVSFCFTTALIDFAENKSYNKTNIGLNINSWKSFSYEDIFEIYGGYYNKKPEEVNHGAIPFIGATERNNGVTSLHDIETITTTSKDGSENNHDISRKIFKGEEFITISNNGSVGCAFYQPIDFTCSHDVNPIKLKKYKLNPYIAMFLCTLIELEKYRWAFGRKWRPIRMPKSQIKLPANSQGEPDWQFMENYIKSLPYSSSL
jgi:type I restriction enzyme M protein